MMHNTKVRLPKAPIVLPIIEMSKLSVGHDFANLKTRSCNYKLWNKASHKLAHRRFTYATACTGDPESLTHIHLKCCTPPPQVSDSESDKNMQMCAGVT